MLTVLISMAVLYVIFGIGSLLLKASFGLFKVLFSAGLFFACPILFFIALFSGLLGSGWFWILLILVICLGGRRRTRVL